MDEEPTLALIGAWCGAVIGSRLGSDERSREASREFRNALQEVVAGGRGEGGIRQGPPELWTDVWLALVGFAAERLSAREWESDSPYVGLTLDAAWDAIAAA